jgi:hypothetical protein
MLVTYLADGALNISNNRSVGVVKEFNSDLGHVTSVTGAAENFVDLRELYLVILFSSEMV